MKKLLPALLAVFCFAAFVNAQNQKLYTLTKSGGSNNWGTIVSMNDNGTGFHVEYNFDLAYGGTPSGNLVMASDGNLYGTCVDGGAYASCVIFRYNPDSGSYRDVYDFLGSEGDFPCSGLIEGSDGKLYGMTPYGGNNGYSGVIYSFEMSTLTYTKLFDFGGNYGANPQGQLLQVGGWLYGMTEQGGNNGQGTLFAYQPVNNSFVVLHHFTGGADGGLPFGSLMYNANGKLYGMTSTGGPASAGTIFSYDLMTSAFTTLHSFAGTDGATPYGTPLLGADGKIYGATSAGGSNNYGVLFTIDPSNNNAFSLEHNFSAATGNYPQGELSQDNNGVIWGTTVAGGSGGYGNIFRFDPSTGVCTSFYTFSATDGQQPNGAVLIHQQPLGIADAAEATGPLNVYPNPANDVLHVSFHNDGNAAATFTIYDVAGKMILSWQEENLPMDYAKPVDVSSLNKGIYFMQVQSGETVTRKRFVVE